MAARKLDRRLWFRLAAGSLVLIALAFCGCTLKEFPQSTVHPQSDYAQSIQRLLETLVFWVVVIFVLVEAALIVTVVRFRARPGAPDPKPIHGNTVLEVAWTVAPALIPDGPSRYHSSCQQQFWCVAFSWVWPPSPGPPPGIRLRQRSRVCPPSPRSIAVLPSREPICPS